MSIFNFIDENGKYSSESGKRRFNRMNGKEAYLFMKEHPVKRRYFICTMTDDEGGEQVYIEIPEEHVNNCRKETRHEQYINEWRHKSGIKEISLSTLPESDEDLVIEDTVSYILSVSGK